MITEEQVKDLLKKYRRILDTYGQITVANHYLITSIESLRNLLDEILKKLHANNIPTQAINSDTKNPLLPKKTVLKFQKEIDEMRTRITQTYKTLLNHNHEIKEQSARHIPDLAALNYALVNHTHPVDATRAKLIRVRQRQLDIYQQTESTLHHLETIKHELQEILSFIQRHMRSKNTSEKGTQTDQSDAFNQIVKVLEYEMTVCTHCSIGLRKQLKTIQNTSQREKLEQQLIQALQQAAANQSDIEMIELSSAALEIAAQA